MDCPKCHAEIRPVPVPNPYLGFRDPVMTVIGAVLSLAGLFAYAGILKQEHCPQCVARTTRRTDRTAGSAPHSDLADV